MQLLVISPSKVFWRGVHNALRGLKHSITECETGAAGLKKLRNGQFETVLLDAGLHDMTGLDFLEQYGILVDDAQRCPLLYFSAQATLDEVLQAVESGIDDFIVLPFDNEVLRKKLDRQVKRVNEEKVRRRAEQPEAPYTPTFVPQPQVIQLDEFIAELEKLEARVPAALPPAPEPDEDEVAARRMRYTRRTTIGV